MVFRRDLSLPITDRVRMALRANPNDADAIVQAVKELEQEVQRLKKQG